MPRQTEPSPTDTAAQLEQLESADMNTRWQAYQALEKRELGILSDLLVIARKKKERYEWTDSREFAVKLLSTLGTREAIPLFVEE